MKKSVLLYFIVCFCSNSLFSQENAVRLSIESFYSDEGPLSSKPYTPEDFERVYLGDPNSYLSRGVKKIESERYKEALPDFNEAIDLAPACGVCYYFRGLNHLLLDSIDQAKKDYKTAIELDIMLIQAYNDLSNILFHEDKIDSAEIILEKGVKFYPAYLPTYFNLGYYKLMQGKRNKALKLFDKCLEIDSCHANTSLFKASILLLSDRLKDAENLLDKFGNCNRQIAELHFLNSVVKYERGKYSEAITEIDKALAINDNYVYYYSRGLLNFEVEKHGAAINDFIKAYRLNPLESKDYGGSNSFRKKQLDFQEILKEYSNIKSSLEAEEVQHLEKAICYFITGNYPKAGAELKKLKKTSEKLDFYHLLVGLSEEKLFDFKRAKESYDKCLAINGKNIEAYKRRGLLLQTFGEFTAAMSDFSAMYKINPQSSEALKYSGIAKMLNRQYDSALTDFEEYESKFEADGDIYFNKAQCQNQLGLQKNAVESYKKALSFNPTDFELILQIAQTDYSIGNFGESLLMCDSILNNVECHLMAINLKGVVQMDLKENEKALLTFKSGIACSPYYQDFHINKGIAFIKLGRYEDAVKQMDFTLTFAQYSGLAYLIRAQAKQNVGDKTACDDLKNAIALGIQLSEQQQKSICD